MEIKKIDNLEIRIFTDLEELSHHACRFFISICQPADIFKVAISGGSTSRRMFELLGTDYQKDIDWPKVHIFWGDDRVAENNNFQTAWQIWLNKVPANVHRIKMELGPTEGARAYSLEIDKFAPQGFDLAFHGAGADGHRNGVLCEKPGIDWKNDVWELPESVKVWGQEVPPEVHLKTKGITLTPWFLNQSEVNVLMLAGKEKADLLRKITIDKDQYFKRELPAITFNEVSTIVLTDKAAAYLI